MSYTESFRRQVLDAMAENGWSFKETASRYELGERTIRRWAELARDTGNLEGGGYSARARLISDADIPLLRKMRGENPEVTIGELVALWFARTGTKVSRTTMRRALKQAGL